MVELKINDGRDVIIAGAEFSERVAGFAIYSNIFSYLFYEKHLDFKYAMNMTTNFIGTSFVLSLLGGYIADTYWGRFHTIFISGFIQCVVSSWLLQLLV